MVTQCKLIARLMTSQVRIFLAASIFWQFAIPNWHTCWNCIYCGMLKCPIFFEKPWSYLLMKLFIISLLAVAVGLGGVVAVISGTGVGADSVGRLSLTYSNSSESEFSSDSSSESSSPRKAHRRASFKLLTTMKLAPSYLEHTDSRTWDPEKWRSYVRCMKQPCQTILPTQLCHLTRTKA